jgi:hypothetical protein
MAIHDLTPRRRAIATLAAHGWSKPRIAKSLGVSLTCVKDACRLPAVRAEIERQVAQLQESVHFELVKALSDEERATFERWRELRDQDKNLPVALGAVRAHFDRVVPKVAVAHDQPAVTITITVEERQQIEIACAEAGIPLPPFPELPDASQDELNRPGFSGDSVS